MRPTIGMIVGNTELSDKVIASAIEVHRLLGLGLLESAYSRCLAHELTCRGVIFEREVTVPVLYKGLEIEHGFRADFVVDGRLLVEIECVQILHTVHRAQAMTHLKMLGLKRGLLINFDTHRLVDGIRSVVI